MVQEIVLIVVGILAGAATVWFLLRRQNTGRPQADEYLINLQKLVTEKMDKVSEQVDRRLGENVQAMNESKAFLANRVSSTERTVREVSMGLGKLEQATDRLQKTNDEIASFQKMLRHPKIRGGFGEVLLNNLLSEMLPADRYAVQYRMKASGEIADAIIRLHDDYIVAIDAKFPLATYEHLMAAESRDTEKWQAQLERDVKKHVADISRKYISPTDKTLDFAFMYIPVESVYYDAIVKGVGNKGLWEYCLANRVIPVSPNSFLAYLYTVLVGLRGLRIEEKAREILVHLGQVRRDFHTFADDFSMVGKHLTNAKNRFDDSARRLDRFSDRLTHLETDTDVASLPGTVAEETSSPELSE